MYDLTKRFHCTQTGDKLGQAGRTAPPADSVWCTASDEPLDKKYRNPGLTRVRTAGLGDETNSIDNTTAALSTSHRSYDNAETIIVIIRDGLIRLRIAASGRDGLFAARLNENVLFLEWGTCRRVIEKLQRRQAARRQYINQLVVGGVRNQIKFNSAPAAPPRPPAA
ncbi:hypothetical protein EVAR_86734_1 [Eumeta japonica]|uniref:Uncharacterized protein n=1 Tax=Eumeta variegata TaxID=151549 RepID=A0A4C1W1T3_EUMVA|nr:hypothetical protein EVAR_86734_1 [Eumeta japonica]